MSPVIRGLHGLEGYSTTVDSSAAEAGGTDTGHYSATRHHCIFKSYLNTDTIQTRIRGELYEWWPKTDNMWVGLADKLEGQTGVGNWSATLNSIQTDRSCISTQYVVTFKFPKPTPGTINSGELELHHHKGILPWPGQNQASCYHNT